MIKKYFLYNNFFFISNSLNKIIYYFNWKNLPINYYYNINYNSKLIITNYVNIYNLIINFKIITIVLDFDLFIFIRFYKINFMKFIKILKIKFIFIKNYFLYRYLYKNKRINNLIYYIPSNIFLHINYFILN